MDKLINYRIYRKSTKVLGISLFELIIALTILSLASTGAVLVYYTLAKSPNFKPLIPAIKIAKNYLNEILNQKFPAMLPCTLSDSPNNRNNIDRTSFKDLCDYHKLKNIGAQTITGAYIPDLENYAIFIELETSDQVILGNLTGGDTTNAELIKINVTVSYPNMPDLIMSVYQGKY